MQVNFSEKSTKFVPWEWTKAATDSQEWTVVNRDVRRSVSVTDLIRSSLLQLLVVVVVVVMRTTVMTMLSRLRAIFLITAPRRLCTQYDNVYSSAARYWCKNVTFYTSSRRYHTSPALCNPITHHSLRGR